MKYTSKRALAEALYQGPVSTSLIGRRLQKTVSLWLSRGEIKSINNKLVLAK